MCIAVGFESASATISSITVSGESNATVHGSPLRMSNAFTTSAQLASLANITASGNKTVTVNFSTSVVCSVLVEEVQGGDTAAFYTGNETSSTGDSNIGSVDPVPFSVTTANANDSIFGATFHNGTRWSGGMTGLTSLTMSSLNNPCFGWNQYDAGVAGTKNFTGTQSVYSVWGVKFGVFKAAGGGGGGATSNPALRAFPFSILQH